MNALTTNTIQRKFRILNRLKKPNVILNLLSLVALVYPIVPMALLAIFGLRIPGSTNELIALLWLIGGPAGMFGLMLAMYNRRNITTILLLTYGIVSYSPLIFSFFTDITSKSLLHILYALYFSIPIIVATIHIGLSIKHLWINRKQYK